FLQKPCNCRARRARRTGYDTRAPRRVSVSLESPFDGLIPSDDGLRLLEGGEGRAGSRLPTCLSQASVWGRLYDRIRIGRLPAVLEPFPFRIFGSGVLVDSQRK